MQSDEKGNVCISEIEATTSAEPLVLTAATQRIEHIPSWDDNVELRTVLAKIAPQYCSQKLSRVVATHGAATKRASPCQT